MARGPEDVTIQLRMSLEERQRINTAVGKGNVNAVAMKLLLEHVAEVEKSQPCLTEEVITAA